MSDWRTEIRDCALSTCQSRGEDGFTPTRRAQRFCSPRCRDRFHNADKSGAHELRTRLREIDVELMRSQTAIEAAREFIAELLGK